MEGKDREQNLFVTDDVKQALFRLRKMSGAIVGMNGKKQSTMTGDALALLADYLWGITLLDISVFNHRGFYISEYGQVCILSNLKSNLTSWIIDWPYEIVKE